MQTIMCLGEYIIKKHIIVRNDLKIRILVTLIFFSYEISPKQIVKKNADKHIGVIH